ncbi:hypothetical protein BDR26DRAFT_388008 [Obelidium mucronatum]|nr:hypothetical protein BDR26DRAFT_388008 [Obelidium mucronatum]
MPSYCCPDCGQVFNKLGRIRIHAGDSGHMGGIPAHSMQQATVVPETTRQQLPPRAAPPPPLGGPAAASSAKKRAPALGLASLEERVQKTLLDTSRFHDEAAGPQYEDVLKTFDDLHLSHGPHELPASLFDTFTHQIRKPKSTRRHGMSLANQHSKHMLVESAFLGVSLDDRASDSAVDLSLQNDTELEQDDGTSESDSESFSDSNEHRESTAIGRHQEIYLNIHEPFCLVALGVQGSGKSHTMSVILENCLLPTRHHNFKFQKDRDIVNLKEPMCALVLHFDQNPQSLCESTGLINPARIAGEYTLPALPREKMTVLVSPSYFKQRRLFYGSYCEVRPLLFTWTTLSADHIKKLMRITEDDNQLYMATLLELLRTYQRTGKKPDFQTFLDQVQELSNVRGQEAPLIQRLNILQSFIIESERNKDIRDYAIDLNLLVKKGNLIITDLTDPMLSSNEVNGVFQLLVEKFRVAPLSNCGKLLALDEVHKFMDGNKEDGLSDAILDTVRLMRHDGIRVCLSTQSPKALLPEILELVSVAVMHRFHSKDWFSYLSAKLPLKDDDFDKIVGLEPGEAIVFAGRHMLGLGDCQAADGSAMGSTNLQSGQGYTLKVGIRPRLTADRGSSRMNK